jgi:hypothetical protein
MGFLLNHVSSLRVSVGAAPTMLCELRPHPLDHGAHSPELQQEAFPIRIVEPEQALLTVVDGFLGLFDGAERIAVIARKPLRLRDEEESENCIEVSLD